MSKLKAFSTEELLETEFPPSGEFVDKQVLLDQLQRTKKLFEETGEKEKAECEQGVIDCVNQLMETYGYEEIEEFHEKAKVSKQGGKPTAIRLSDIPPAPEIQWIPCEDDGTHFISNASLESGLEEILITYQVLDNWRHRVKKVTCDHGQVVTKIYGVIKAWSPMPFPYYGNE